MLEIPPFFFLLTVPGVYEHIFFVLLYLNLATYGMSAGFHTFFFFFLESCCLYIDLGLITIDINAYHASTMFSSRDQICNLALTHCTEQILLNQLD